MATRHGFRTAALALAAVLLGVVTWLNPVPAYACSCVYESDDPRRIQTAEVIFVGTVSRDRVLGGTRTYTLTVDRVYRGQVHQIQTVRTNVGSAACELDLDGAGPLLLMGYHQQGLLWTNSCGGTRSGGPPAHLGEGYPPRSGSSAPDVSWLPLVGGLVALVGAAAVATALGVARRSDR